MGSGHHDAAVCYTAIVIEKMSELWHNAMSCHVIHFQAVLTAILQSMPH